MGEIEPRKGKIQGSKCTRLTRPCSLQSQHLGQGGHARRCAAAYGPCTPAPAQRPLYKQDTFNKDSWPKRINQWQLFGFQYKWILDLRYCQMGRQVTVY